MTTRNRPVKWAAAAVVAAALTISVPDAAQANPPVEHSAFSIDESGSFDAAECGFPIDWHDTGRVSLMLRNDPRTGDQLILQKLDITSIFTNPATGVWFGISGHWSEHLLPAKTLRDGAVVAVLKEPGNRNNLFDEDGVIARDTGLTQWTFTFDPATDEEDAGVEFHGNFPVTGTDLCVLAQDLIG